MNLSSFILLVVIIVLGLLVAAQEVQISQNLFINCQQGIKFACQELQGWRGWARKVLGFPMPTPTESGSNTYLPLIQATP